MRSENGYGAPEERRSPECVEGEFSEVRIQDSAYPNPCSLYTCAKSPRFLQTDHTQHHAE